MNVLPAASISCSVRIAERMHAMPAQHGRAELNRGEVFCIDVFDQGEPSSLAAAWQATFSHGRGQAAKPAKKPHVSTLAAWILRRTITTTHAGGVPAPEDYDHPADYMASEFNRDAALYARRLYVDGYSPPWRRVLHLTDQATDNSQDAKYWTPDKLSEGIRVSIPGIEGAATLAEMSEISQDWKTLNDRRALLIAKSLSSGLDEAEDAELTRLKRLARLKRAITFPAVTDKLEALIRALEAKKAH